jgi:hypothetical protein
VESKRKSAREYQRRKKLNANTTTKS